MGEYNLEDESVVEREALRRKTLSKHNFGHDARPPLLTPVTPA